MDEDVRIVSVDASTVEREGFFCFKSKPKTPGYRRKLEWLRQRFSEGMTLDILYEGKRSFAFLEAIPGKCAWRAVDAPDYMVIHCIWTVGTGKKHGYATQLLEHCEERAKKAGLAGVAMLTSDAPFLADRKFFLKRGYTQVDAAGAFQLLVKRLANAANPTLAIDWEARAAAFGPGLTVVRTDQCPYWDDATNIALSAAEQHGIPARSVELHSAEEVQRLSPSPYGTFALVLNGKLVSHYYRLPKELDALLGSGPAITA